MQIAFTQLSIEISAGRVLISADAASIDGEATEMGTALSLIAGKAVTACEIVDEADDEADEPEAAPLDYDPAFDNEPAYPPEPIRLPPKAKPALTSKAAPKGRAPRPERRCHKCRQAWTPKVDMPKWCPNRTCQAHCPAGGFPLSSEPVPAPKVVAEVNGQPVGPLVESLRGQGY